MAKIGFLSTLRGAIVALALLALALQVTIFGDTAFAAEGRKLALVIGNDAYENQPALAKAVGDAHAMQATLQKLGFEVRLAENLGYAGMVETLAAFQSSIEPGDTVAIHFSGHGVAANGRNYLLPVDFPQPESGRQGEVLLPRLAFDAGEIVDGLRSQGAKLTLAVFDACRDNALTAGTRSIGMSRGLVRMDPPRGVFVMFSAGPGELAADRLTDDDPEATSVFTRVFIPILETPGLTLVEIAKRTQVQVSELAATVDHAQFPDYSDRVIGDVILLPKTEPSEPTPQSVLETNIATIDPTDTPLQPNLPLAGEVAAPAPPVDEDVALCDSVAGDPHDPFLPAPVDRSQLYDLERIVDVAAADDEARKLRPDYEELAITGMPGAAVACEAAVQRHPENKRLAYQKARAICLSGLTENCPDAIKGLIDLGHPSAAKFAGFAMLSTLEDKQAAGGFAGMLKEVRLPLWFGLPSGPASESAELAETVHRLLRLASDGGDREARSILLLFDVTDQDTRIAKLHDAAAQGSPIGLAAIATFVQREPPDFTSALRLLLAAAISKGSDLSRIVLLTEFEQDKSPETLAKARELLTPEVIARSPTAAMVLKRIETEVLAALPAENSGNAGSVPDAASPSVEPPGVVDPANEKYMALAGREIWISASPDGKEIAARVEERLRSVGMSVTIFDGDPQYGWDHDLDYGPSSSETAPLVQELLADIYPTDLTFAETREVLNVTITPGGEASVTPPSGQPAAVDASDDKYKALAGRDIWIMVNPNGKAKAALVEERLKAVGMNVLINEVANEDYNDWDGDLDYEAKDTEMVGLVKELISDLYTMDLAIADERTIPNITITPRQ
jgi:hypothetical protein